MENSIIPTYYITASCTILDNTIHKDESVFWEAGPMDAKDFLVSAYRRLDVNYPKFFKMDHLSRLGFLCAEVLLSERKPTMYNTAEDTGMVLFNASGSLDTDLRYMETMEQVPSPALFVYTLPNIVMGEICIRHGIKGENAFFVTDTFDTEFFQQYVINLFNNDILQACIGGWIDYLDGRYQASLMLVEKAPQGLVTFFDLETINKICFTENGKINGRP